MSEVKEFSTKENENYMTVCGLANREKVAFYTATNPAYRARMHEGMNWCWVHGFHQYSKGGDYAFTTYTNMQALEAAIADRKAQGKEDTWDTLNDAKCHAKPVINVRDRFDHEWDFEVPEGLIGYVVNSLQHHPKLLKFVIDHGMTIDTAFYLAEISVPYSEERSALAKLLERTQKLTSRLYYTFDKNGDPITSSDGEYYIVNPELTAGQRSKKYHQIKDFEKSEKARLADVRRKEVRRIRQEHKQNPIILPTTLH